MLGLLLFDIFLNYFINIIVQAGVCRFADHNIISSCGKSVEVVVSSLEEDKSMSWFETNKTVVNTKFLVMLFGLNSK